jgi:hypothetical protein
VSVQLTRDPILGCDTLERKVTDDPEPLALLNVRNLAGYDQDGLPDKEFMFTQCALPSWRARKVSSDKISKMLFN